MAVDPTGMNAALATIQPGALSERQQRIAVGLAMLERGHSYREAADVSKIPLSTLWDYRNDKRSLSERKTSDPRDVEAVTELATDIAIMAGEAIRDSLSDPDIRRDWKPGDLIKAYGVAVDKILALNQVSAGDDQDGESLLKSLLAGHKLTIEPARLGDDAIEVNGAAGDQGCGD